jgi:outer membrane protein OmpA-like peptidoglycan-associated protein
LLNFIKFNSSYSLTLKGTTMKNINRNMLVALITIFMVSSCATDEFGNRRSLTSAEKGAIIGATAGALLGLRSDEKKKAVLYGIIGGIAGGAVGSYMDAQRKDFQKVLADEINSGAIELHQLPEHNLMVTMTSQTAFEVDSTSIQPGFHSTMDKIAQVVNKYGKTHLSIVGHTDSTGSRAYNQKLSERRATSIQQYLYNKKVIPQRMTVYGLGEDKPRADNNTKVGRTLNRRVEIVIEPVVAPS